MVQQGTPKVAILTSLTDFSPAYSLTGIIRDQARMLEREGWDYELLCLANFNAADKEAIVREGLKASFDLPSTVLHDYQPGESARPEFESQVDTHYEGYAKALEGFDVVITHDLMFLGWYLPQNAAIRRLAEERPQLQWRHWCHSGPSGRPHEMKHPSSFRFSAAPNSRYVYLNNRQRQDVANHFGIKPRDIRVCFNPKDIRDLYEFSPETCELIEYGDLLSHDVFVVYPFSTPRWKSKGVDKIVATLGNMQRLGVRCKLVLINAHCTQSKDEAEVRKIEEVVDESGLGKNCVFTSRFAAEAAMGVTNSDYDTWGGSVPHRVVRELFLASNLFMLPSESECCSLVQAEAAVSGKFTVLNANFLPTFDFAAETTTHYAFSQHDVAEHGWYYEALARELWAILRTDPNFMTQTKARTQWYNRDWIWTNQLQPILMEGRL